jgi:hypothetical protein
MKITSLKLLQPVTLAALTLAIICGVSAPPAQAGYIVTLQQVGSKVVATGSGAIDLAGLTFFSPSGGVAEMQPITASIFTGPSSAQPLDMYGQASGPTSFGSGGGRFANSGSGDAVGIEGIVGFIFVPQGYLSGSPLSDSATYNSATISSLGITPGVYEWTWGTGVNQNFTVDAVGAPDSGSTFGLFLFAVATLFGGRRFRAFRLA